jgi:DNA-directed RNA polymerase specialized sigma24 family protein
MESTRPPAIAGQGAELLVGLRGFKLNPALLTYIVDAPRPGPTRRRSRRRERQISKRLDTETVERLVTEYVGGASSAELGRRYGIAKSSVLRLVRHAGEAVRHPRLSETEMAQLIALYEAGLPQKDIAEHIGRSPSAVWHFLRRLGMVGIN